MAQFTSEKLAKPLFFGDRGIVWYRNYHGRYHARRTDWILTGKAKCGRNIPHPIFTATNLQREPNSLPTCKNCLKRVKE